MPNHLTHWLIAQRAAADLGGTVFEEPLARYRPCLMIGAVFHDALFYLPGRSPLAGFGAVASRLHGEDGEDTYELPRALAGLIRRGRSGPELTAFLAGLACHIGSDTVFHPFVFHHTGPIDPRNKVSASRSVQAHRRLEAALDLHFAGGFQGLKTYSLRSFLDQAGPWTGELFALAGELLAGPGAGPEQVRGLAQAFRISFERFAKAQVFFQNRAAARLLFSLRRALPRGLREIGALGYHGGLKWYLDLLKRPIPYRHPVTGAEEVVTVEQLFERAVSASVRLCGNLAELISTGTCRALEEAGPGLSSGLPGTPSDRLVDFAPRRLVGPRNRSRG